MDHTIFGNFFFPENLAIYSFPLLMSSSVFKIAALPGDGIGPEVMREAIKVLRVVEKKFAPYPPNHRGASWLGGHRCRR